MGQLSWARRMLLPRSFMDFLGLVNEVSDFSDRRIAVHRCLRWSFVLGKGPKLLKVKVRLR